MKKFRYIIAAVFVVIMGTTIFYGCEKENNNSKINNIKVQKSINEFTQYESYTPNNSEIVSLLLDMTNYMNHSEEFTMPDIELSKAIWLMESFFNIGVCNKQNLLCKQRLNSITYTFAVGYEIDEFGNYLLNGSELQSEYHQTLCSIINNICSEYAMDFGDIFVNEIRIDENIIFFGIDVNYGIKADEEEYFLPVRCFASINEPLFIGPTQNVNYPASSYNDDYIYIHPMCCGSVRDVAMEKVLNCRFLLGYCSNVIKFERYFLNIYHSNFSIEHYSGGSAPGDFVAHNHENLFSRTGSGELTPSEYLYYGDVYRDSIYAKMVQDIPSGFIPYKAACFYFCFWPVSMVHPTLDFHNFGI